MDAPPRNNEVPPDWEARVQNLMQRYPAASRDDVVAALHDHGGHAGRAAADLPQTAEQVDALAERAARYEEQAAEQRAERATGEDWARRARGGGRCFTDGGTFTPWGAACVVDAMRSLGRSIGFASKWDGRTLYSWSSSRTDLPCSSQQGSIRKEFESVHGGPRIGEPGNDGALISVEKFCALVVDDHNKHENTFAVQTRSWFDGVP